MAFYPHTMEGCIVSVCICVCEREKDHMDVCDEARGFHRWEVLRWGSHTGTYRLSDAHWSLCTVHWLDELVFFFKLSVYKSDFCKPSWYFVSANPYTDLFVKGDQSFCIRLWNNFWGDQPCQIFNFSLLLFYLILFPSVFVIYGCCIVKIQV